MIDMNQTQRRLGQFFTPPDLVQLMLALKQNKGRVLEPSCGDGAFAQHLPKHFRCALELDPTYCPPYARNMDFFTYSLENKFATVIGNPPYVKNADIVESTRKHLPTGFNRKANLYLFFIQKCVRHLSLHGELIFVVPREFATATSAARLHTWMWKLGHYTHFEDIGDTTFGDANLPCVVFRWQRTPLPQDPTDSRPINNGRLMYLSNGRLQFHSKGKSRTVQPIGNTFHVHVGGVTAADALFESLQGNVDVVCSSTATDGKTRKMLHGNAVKKAYQGNPVAVGKLMARGIRQFNKNNWWEWGRNWYESDSPRIYVNCRTRNEKPFFIHPATAYDGSVLALFPHDPETDLQAWCDHLNAQDWAAMGFKSSGRYIFSAGALQACLIEPPVLG